jgi:hypothetical protein
MLSNEQLSKLTKDERFWYYSGYCDGMERGGEMLHEILSKDEKENKDLEKSA